MYKRVLLKLTGELFGGSDNSGIDFQSVAKVAGMIARLKSTYKIDLAIVLGGGNLFRGRRVTDTSFDRASADYIGMLGTVMNGLALQGELDILRVENRVMSSLKVEQACEPYIRLKAMRHLQMGRVTILVGGTGRPFFTTDTTAALLAAELDCQVLLKGSNVTGVFDRDPKQHPDATLFETLSFQDALKKELMVMDDTAFAVCKRENIPIIVFDVQDLDNIEKIIRGDKIGTLVS